MILTASNLIIKIVLEAAKTTNDVEFTGSISDKSQNNLIVPGCIVGKANGLTPVVLVPAVMANISRLIEDIFVYNADTVTQVAQIGIYDGVTFYRMRRVSMLTLTGFQYNRKSGWSV